MALGWRLVFFRLQKFSQELETVAEYRDATLHSGSRSSGRLPNSIEVKNLKILP